MSTRANRAGRILERFVEAQLADQNYERVEPRRFFAMRELEQPIYGAQVEVGLDIYSKRRRVDFILYHPRIWPECLVIQCKWQASRGSVEEKYPFEVLSIAANEFKTIVVLDGGGYTAGAKQWFMGQAGKTKLLHVFDQGEFARYVSNGRI